MKPIDMIWFKYIFVIQYIYDILKIYAALQIFFYIFHFILLQNFESIVLNSNNFYMILKNIILCLLRGLFFSKWSYSKHCFDVAQRCSNQL